MKKIFKFMPVALGLLTLASCSSDDFSSDSAQAVDLSDKIVMNVTEEDEAGTRAYRDADQKVSYEATDLLRVYDSKLQAYDVFQFNAAAKTFIIPAAQTKVFVGNREDGLYDYAYAIFGSPAGDNNVSYAGWKDGYNVALMKIENTFNYKEFIGNTATGDNQVVYKATLPQWGTVTPVVGERQTAYKSFNTSLRYLTGRAKVVFENGKATMAKKVRVTSLKFADGKAIADFTGLNPVKGQNTPDLTGVATTVGAKPLAGWFEAVLDTDKKEDCLREITDATGSVTPAAGTSIEINISSAALMDDYTNVFFFPIVPATYDLLLFEYQVGTEWKYIGYKTGAVARSEKIEGDDLTVTSPLNVAVDGINTTFALSKQMAQNTIEGAPVTLNINGTSGAIVTTNEDAIMNTIYIPQLKNNMVVNIGKTTGPTTDITAKELTIMDADGADNSKFSVTFNFISGFEATSKYITLNSKAKVTLAGDFTGITTTADGKKDINVTSTGGLSLGITGLAAAGGAIFKANKINVAAGTVGVAGDLGGGTKSVITELTSTAKATVAEGTVTTLIANNVEISSGEVTILQLADADATVTMTGGLLSDFNKHSAALTANRTVTVTTSGAAEIVETNPTNWNFAVAEGVSRYTYSFKSTWNDETTASAATQVKKIYTAAQLAALDDDGADATDFDATLMTDIEIATTTAAPFVGITPDDDLDEFNGNSKTISKLPAALFTTLTDGLTVKDLTLKNANIETPVKTSTSAYNGFGVVANEVLYGATAILDNVVVSNATLGLIEGKSGSRSYSYGLLVGYVAGTLTATDCGVNGTVQGYYNLGGYVGELDGGTLTIGKTEDKLTANMSSVKFVKSFTTSETEDENAGKIGNFIGSITAASKFVLGDAVNATAFNKFFSSNQITATEIANAEKNAGKAYIGMENKEIGLSTGSLAFGAPGATTSQLYGKYEYPAVGTTPAVGYTMANTVNLYATE